MRFDFHVHTRASNDCDTPATESAQAAIAAGLDGICFTDHCDLIHGEFPGRPMAECYTNWARSYEEVEGAREEWGDQIEILHGMELAEIIQDPERARQCAAAPGLDFLMGAIHAMTGYHDFYFMDYPDLATCRKLAKIYLDENIRMAELDIVDVVAHVGYFNRYTSRFGFTVDLMDYEERLRHLFGTLAQNGRGIEVNTSGLRRNPGPNWLIPDLPVLKLFRECGGEIVTIGSDAHMAKHVGNHLAEAEEALRAVGFTYTAIFRQRKPAFNKL